MKITEIEKRIKYAINWIIDSGVQNIHDDDTKGGFYAWYDNDNDEYAFIYSEITGYALNLLIAFESKINHPRINNSISLANRFLIEKAFDEDFGAVKCRFEKDNGWVKNYCTFDNAMVANALANKNRLDGDKDALDVAIIILNTIMNKLIHNNRLYARYISSEDRYQNDNTKWSTYFGSFYAKLAIPFLNIYDLTKDSKYLDFIENVISSLLPFQKSSGRFITCSKSSTTFLHAHLYSIEGLLAASLYLRNNDYNKTVKKALDWANSLELENGGIAGFVLDYEKIKLDSPDINSQFLRCLLLSGLTKNTKITKLIDRIFDFQIISEVSKKKNGGFKIGDIWFYNHEQLRMEKTRNHINTWAAIFALNAIYYFYYLDKDPFTLC